MGVSSEKDIQTYLKKRVSVAVAGLFTHHAKEEIYE